MTTCVKDLNAIFIGETNDTAQLIARRVRQSVDFSVKIFAYSSFLQLIAIAPSLVHIQKRASEVQPPKECLLFCNLAGLKKSPLNNPFSF